MASGSVNANLAEASQGCHPTGAQDHDKDQKTGKTNTGLDVIRRLHDFLTEKSLREIFQCDDKVVRQKIVEEEKARKESIKCATRRESAGQVRQAL